MKDFLEKLKKSGDIKDLKGYLSNIRGRIEDMFHNCRQNYNDSNLRETCPVPLLVPTRATALSLSKLLDTGILCVIVESM